MTQDKKYDYLYDGLRSYIFDTKKLSPDDFFRLEQIAAIENEMMKHKIFFVSEVNEGKVITGLN